ncbi:hypothetical protein GJ698_20075 [Pseudoduganella sp. FT26W]|uniref:Lipoprotein n=1 Tax=Duganella aquatilis TaxID=2666082 RepID=A0A844D8L6_9BURK|nr:hypothetical protein [Duganella aquatilis]MRW86375.1 hypothetical protein [Duganella aquatilis]
MKLNRRRKVATSLAALILLSGCGKSSEKEAAEQRVLDADPTVVSACTFDALYPVHISMLDVEETSAVCEKMARAMGHNPSVKQLRHLARAVGLLSVQGRTKDVVGTAYQFMRVVEVRGQLKNEQAMYATIELVFKIANGTDGRVMPKDLNVFLTSLGKGAKTMSDQGLINSASMLSIMKQDQGG